MKCFARHIFRLASLCVVVLTMVGSLSSCRRYAGDEVVVGSALAMADIAVDYYRLRRWLSERNRHLYARAMIQKADVSVDYKDYKKAIEIISDVQKSVDGEYYDLVAKNNMVLARISFIKNESPSERIKLLKSFVKQI